MDHETTTQHLVEVTQSRFFGKYRGIVKANEDPERRGRLQLIVPAVLGDAVIWALPCVPYAGPNVGFYAMPPVDAGVWVEFEAGDPSYPIWVGCYWASRAIPQQDAKPHIKYLKTESLCIRFDDQEGVLEIRHNDADTSLRLSPTEIKEKATNVVAESGAKRTALTPNHFDVHDGAFTVV